MTNSKEYMQKWRAEHKEQIKAYYQKWLASDKGKEHIRKHNAQYKEYRKQWRAKNKDKVKLYNARYQAKLKARCNNVNTNESNQGKVS